MQCSVQSSEPLCIAAHVNCIFKIMYLAAKGFREEIIFQYMLPLSELYYQFLLVHSLGVTLILTSDVIKRQQQFIHSVCTAYKGLQNASSSGLKAQAEE